jgi:sugar lactone lactonase YvrE
MRSSLFFALSALFPALLLTGCTLKTTAPASQAHGAAIEERVRVGQQTIVGANIYIMVANTTGYGAASKSLLDSNATGHSDSIGGYVLTGSGGLFSITGDYSCSASQQVYLLAVGGDAGAGDNPAAALMSVLGQCPSGSTNFLATEPFLLVNEVTTVAGVYALSGYMTDMLHVSSSGTALANTGMANAFLTAAELADISSGAAYTTTPAGNGIVPQSKINTLANILSACVNSNGAISSTPTPTTCYALFSNATSDGTSSGTQPTETVTAALNMAHNPGANVANLYSLAPGTAPFQPSAASITDLTLALSFTGGGLNHPEGLAVDGSGNVWTSNRTSSGSASKFAAGTGAALSPTGTGFIGGGIFLPGSIAIDGSNNVWIGDASSGGTVADAHLTKLAEDGTPVSATGYNLGIVGDILSIGIDNLGNAIVAPVGSAYKVDGATGAVTALARNNTVTSFSLATAPNGTTWVGTGYPTVPGVNQLDGTGTIVFPSSTGPYRGPPTGLENPISIAIDHAGNVWVANGGTVNGSATYGIAEFSSTGTLLLPAGPLPVPGTIGAIAIDGVGHVIVATGQNTIVVLNNDGSSMNPYGYSDSSLNTINAVAVDGSGNVWAANYLGSSITEFVGLAAPVVTPIAAGVANNTLGTRP